ncbi:hypothetical protein F511_42812 [Dorcoceras hygrometricum]|uniref:RING-type domain-containing protein n=1 Tax=Dorcoceras hygrometricum TaxID=472368 RepID=A0A2Z6ZZ82_9LAMI|nr:hypothetical protein F511_42812 [Dorcoceras hygrometricum]
MTLNTMLSDKRGPIRPGEEQFPRVHSNRTLSDIIRDESGGTAHYYTGKKSWRHFKDKLRRRRGAAWTSTFSTPASDIPINNRSMNRRPSGGFPSDMAHPLDISAVPDVDPDLMSNTRSRPSLQRNASRAMERASGRPEHVHSMGMRRLQREDNGSEDENDDNDEEEHESEEGESGSEDDDEEANVGGQQPVRMSLMSLLAETDREMGLDGSSYMLDDEDEDDDEDDDGDGDGGEYNNCCVCMVRHKGTAFVPCGHSFCRLCSRELWAQRGNCPLCNNYILEILDIF